ncbi:MAG: hypothetical protein JXA67_11115 [Micromonosporaceae bacterium]|nr:hypothetical protein [Micromonosporaceae bacterium]
MGGRRATAGGRAQALRARGYNQAAVAERQHSVLALRMHGLTYRAIAEHLGISPAQAHRDYWGLVRIWPDGWERIDLGNQLLDEHLGPPRRTYRELAERHRLGRNRVGELIREARRGRLVAAVRASVWP